MKNHSRLKIFLLASTFFILVGCGEKKCASDEKLVKQVYRDGSGRSHEQDICLKMPQVPQFEVPQIHPSPE